jgi:parvulin-like peptidyl-prolyl isomerase
VNPRARASILACAAVLAAGGLGECTRREPELGALAKARRVEQVGEFKLDEASLQRYVRVETGLTTAEVDPLGRARLAEDLLAEALLARCAEREKSSPSPVALADELARLQSIFGAKAPPEALREDALRRVLARLCESQVIARGITITAQAVEDELRRLEKKPAEEEVVFRQLRVDSEDAAEQAYQEVTAGAPFERVAAQVSTAPDKGRPLARPLSALPRPAGDALREAREGSVSRPIPLDGAYYLFQLDARSAGAELDRARRREDIKRQLLQRAFDARRREKLNEMALAEGVRAPVPSRPAEDSR